MPLAAIEGFEGIGAIPAKDLVSAFFRADQIVATKAVNPLLFLRSCELIRAIRTAQLSFLAQESVMEAWPKLGMKCGVALPQLRDLQRSRW